MEDKRQISLIYPACFAYILFLKNVKMIPNPFLLSPNLLRFHEIKIYLSLIGPFC